MSLKTERLGAKPSVPLLFRCILTACIRTLWWSNLSSINLKLICLLKGDAKMSISREGTAVVTKKEVKARKVNENIDIKGFKWYKGVDETNYERANKTIASVYVDFKFKMFGEGCVISTILTLFAEKEGGFALSSYHTSIEGREKTYFPFTFSNWSKIEEAIILDLFKNELKK